MQLQMLKLPSFGSFLPRLQFALLKSTHLLSPFQTLRRYLQCPLLPLLLCHHLNRLLLNLLHNSSCAHLHLLYLSPMPLLFCNLKCPQPPHPQGLPRAHIPPLPHQQDWTIQLHDNLLLTALLLAFRLSKTGAGKLKKCNQILLPHYSRLKCVYLWPTRNLVLVSGVLQTRWEAGKCN